VAIPVDTIGPCFAGVGKTTQPVSRVLRGASYITTVSSRSRECSSRERIITIILLRPSVKSCALARSRTVSTAPWIFFPGVVTANVILSSTANALCCLPHPPILQAADATPCHHRHESLLLCTLYWTSLEPLLELHLPTF